MPHNLEQVLFDSCNVGLQMSRICTPGYGIVFGMMGTFRGLQIPFIWPRNCKSRGAGSPLSVLGITNP